jgi:hypothetical protein
MTRGGAPWLRKAIPRFPNLRNKINSWLHGALLTNV